MCNNIHIRFLFCLIFYVLKSTNFKTSNQYLVDRYTQKSKNIQIIYNAVIYMKSSKSCVMYLNIMSANAAVDLLKSQNKHCVIPKRLYVL